MAGPGFEGGSSWDGNDEWEFVESLLEQDRKEQEERKKQPQFVWPEDYYPI